MSSRAGAAVLLLRPWPAGARSCLPSARCLQELLFLWPDLGLSSWPSQWPEPGISPCFAILGVPCQNLFYCPSGLTASLQETCTNSLLRCWFKCFLGEVRKNGASHPAVEGGKRAGAEVGVGFINPKHCTSGPCENSFTVGHSGEVSFLPICDALILCQKGRKIWVRYQLISNSWPLRHNFSSQTRKVAGLSHSVRREREC